MISLEYIAGFFDGEGSVGVYRASRPNGRTNHYLRVQLCQNVSPLSEALFDELVERFNGSVSRQKTRTGVKMNWQISSENAVAFLQAIEPFLILKRPQAMAVLDWWAIRPKVLERSGAGRFVPVAHPEDLVLSDQLRAMKKA